MKPGSKKGYQRGEDRGKKGFVGEVGYNMKKIKLLQNTPL
jgi:hypothetical protein